MSEKVQAVAISGQVSNLKDEVYNENGMKIVDDAFVLVEKNPDPTYRSLSVRMLQSAQYHRGLSNSLYNIADDNRDDNNNNADLDLISEPVYRGLSSNGNTSNAQKRHKIAAPSLHKCISVPMC